MDNSIQLLKMTAWGKVQGNNEQLPNVTVNKYATSPFASVNAQHVTPEGAGEIVDQNS
jgi:hypothetical protein